MRKKRFDVRLSIYVPKKLYDEIERIALLTGNTMSDLMRSALYKEFLGGGIRK